MWKHITRGVRQTLQRRLCDCTDVPAHQDVQTNKNQEQFLSLSKRLLGSFCEILCNQTAETITRPCGSSHDGEHHTNGRWNTYSNLGTQHALWGAVGWSGALVLGWVISQPIWYKQLWNQDDKSEPEQDVGTNLLTLFSKFTNGQALAYVLPHKGAVSAPKLAIENLNSFEKAFDEAAEELRTVHEKAMGEAENRQGILLMSQHHNGEAIKHFRRASQLNYPPGAFNLAQCYELGIGTKQDFKQAAEWYKIASDQGHATAMYNLGVFYAHGWGGLEASSAEARKLFVKAARLGQKDAQAALDIHQDSSKRDTKEINLVSAVDNLHIKSVSMSTEANSSSHIEAKKFGGTQNRMLIYEPDAAEYYKGLCHEFGWGVPVDMAVAAEHYSKAALDGNSSAMYNLAAYFERTPANGMPNDVDIMVQLYKMAADQGHVQASTRLQTLQLCDKLLK